MNNVVLAGRLTRDPDVRYAEGESTIASFSVAVDRRFKTQDGQTADFINCKAFSKTAEFVEKYFRQGNRIVLNGEIRTGSYTNKDGAKIYTTDVFVNNVEFGGDKNSGGQVGETGRPSPSNASGDGFMNIPDGIDEELPFN